MLADVLIYEREEVGCSMWHWSRSRWYTEHQVRAVCHARGVGGQDQYEVLTHPLR